MSESQTNASEFTVSEISGALKRVVEDAFGHVRIRGEISGYRGQHSSGHAYFTLKDERARIDAVIWRGVFGKLRFPPEEGMEVVATGKLTTYPGSSKYQIVIEALEPAGAGALMALLEERKRKLAGEGLFDAARKQLLPELPNVIGVVTSPTGAVIRDIIHRITDRFPLHVIVWPVRVQGETSGQEVARAIRGFNTFTAGAPLARPDVIIVARGGGSLEDLWGFNDEIVVRAAAESDIPLISAVGHETDWTLLDLAADVRAPTPTGAAEMAVPVKAELEATLASLSARLSGSLSRSMDRKREAVRAAARALPQADQLLALPRRRFDEASTNLSRMLRAHVERKRAQFDRIGGRLRPGALEARMMQLRTEVQRSGNRLPDAFSRCMEKRHTRLETAGHRLRPDIIGTRLETGRISVDRFGSALPRLMVQMLERQSRRLEQSSRLLRTLSYQGTLERGFALVRDTSGQPLSTAAQMPAGKDLVIELRDGSVRATAQGPHQATEATTKRSPASKAKKQGELF